MVKSFVEKLLTGVSGKEFTIVQLLPVLMMTVHVKWLRYLNCKGSQNLLMLLTITFSLMFISAVNIILYSNYLNAKHKQEISSLQTQKRVSVSPQNFQREDVNVSLASAYSVES
jgi:hypothetical protein